MSAQDNWHQSKRLGGLWRFAIAISILNILGHTVLGFEQAWAHPFVALATAYGTELILESVDAWACGRRPNYLGSVRTLVEFLLSAHITGLAVSMLLYPNERFWVIGFTAATAIASKWVFCVAVPASHSAPGTRRARHYLNPSNFGISATLLLFPWVGIAPPYQFTENIRGPFDIILPLIIVCTGSLLNTLFTGRVPLILAWLAGFATQAVLRGVLFGEEILAALAPMTGLAFLLFTFYMVTDPGTTPSSKLSQIVFGASVAATYGMLMACHVAFGLFFALAIVTIARGAALTWNAAAREPASDLFTPAAATGRAR